MDRERFPAERRTMRSEWLTGTGWRYMQPAPRNTLPSGGTLCSPLN